MALNPVPVPVGHQAEISPPGATVDEKLDEATLFLKSIGLNYEVRRVLKLRIDERFFDLLSEYPEHPERKTAERFSDISSFHGKKFRSLLPFGAVMDTTTSELLKVHLMFKAVVQSGISHHFSFHTAATEKSTHAVIDIDTVSTAKIYAFITGDYLYVASDSPRCQMITLERIFRRVGNLDEKWLSKSDDTAFVQTWIAPAGLVDYASTKVSNRPAPKGKDGKPKGDGKGDPAPKGKDGKAKGNGKGKDFKPFDGKGNDFYHPLPGKGKGGPQMPKGWDPHGNGPPPWYDPYYDGPPKGKQAWPIHPAAHAVHSGMYGLPFSGKDWLYEKGKGSKGHQNDATANPGPQPAPRPSLWGLRPPPEPATANAGPLIIQTAGAEHLESEDVLNLTDGNFMSNDILDCLDIPDPGSNGRANFNETGLHKSLQNKLLSQDAFLDVLQQGKVMLERRGMLFVMCRHGFHRSVGCAEILGAEMRAHGFSVEIKHHTLHKHATRTQKPKGAGKSRVSKAELKDLIFRFGHALDCRALAVPDGDDEPPGETEMSISDEDGPPESENSHLMVSLDDHEAALDVRDKEIETLKAQLALHESQAQARRPQNVLQSAPTRPVQQSRVDAVQSRTQKKLADERLSKVLQDRRYEYMSDYCVYSESAGKYFCRVCLKWSPEQNTRIPYKEASVDHVNSREHLTAMSRHFHNVGNKEKSDELYGLLKYKEQDQKRQRTF